METNYNFKLLTFLVSGTIIFIGFSILKELHCWISRDIISEKKKYNSACACTYAYMHACMSEWACVRACVRACVCVCVCVGVIFELDKLLIKKFKVTMPHDKKLHKLFLNNS